MCTLPSWPLSQTPEDEWATLFSQVSSKIENRSATLPSWELLSTEFGIYGGNSSSADFAAVCLPFAICEQNVSEMMPLLNGTYAHQAVNIDKVTDPSSADF